MVKWFSDLVVRSERWLRRRRFAVSPFISGVIFGYPFYEFIRIGWWKAGRAVSAPGHAGNVVNYVPPYELLTRGLQRQIGDPETLRFIIGQIEWTFRLSSVFLAIYCVKLYLSLTVFDGKVEYHQRYVHPLGGFARVLEVVLRAGAYLGMSVMLFNYDWMISHLGRFGCVKGLEPFLALWIGVGVVLTTFLIWDILIWIGSKTERTQSPYLGGHLLLWLVSAANVSCLVQEELLGTYVSAGLVLLAVTLIGLMFGIYFFVIRGSIKLFREFIAVTVHTYPFDSSIVSQRGPARAR